MSVVKELEFGVLGSLTVTREGRAVPVDAPKLRALLATLLVRANQPTSFGCIARRLWAEEQPQNIRRVVHLYVTRLRRALGGDVIRTHRDGYLIDLRVHQLDLLRFDELVGAADQTEDDARLAGLLDEALGLWRDTPIADVGSEVLRSEDVPPLVERRLLVEERRTDVRLRRGEHSVLVPRLRILTTENPYRERFWAQLVLALYRSGRQAEALTAYRTVDRMLAEELGIGPGVELRNLHQAVLRGDPALNPPPSAGAGVTVRAPAWTTQCQLPLDIGDLVGREEAAGHVERLLRRREAVPIVTVSGVPGVGKTALAVRAAHRSRRCFPHGQLYARLTGDGDAPRDPAHVLSDLLRSTGLGESAVPGTLDARAAAFRARLADRRVLLFLDDARSSEQVRPLLPGTAGSAVVVTSRYDLTGLTALHSGRRVRLDLLNPREAHELLVRLLGGRVVAREADAAAELVELCGSLPLTLRIAAGLVGRSAAPIADLLAALRRGGRRPDAAGTGDPGMALRSVSRRSLPAGEPDAQLLRRLLGLVPGGRSGAAAGCPCVRVVAG